MSFYYPQEAGWLLKLKVFLKETASVYKYHQVSIRFSPNPTDVWVLSGSEKKTLLILVNDEILFVGFSVKFALFVSVKSIYNEVCTI